MPMKKLTFFFLIITIFTFLITCQKDEHETQPEPQPDPSTDYMVYETSSGDIGSAGGEIHIADLNSKINNTIVEIPSGALKAITNIKVEQVEIESPFLNDVNLISIRLLPEGLIFNNPIKVTIPYPESYETSDGINIWYYNENDSVHSIMSITNYDTNSKTVSFETNHFSIYYSTKGNIEFDVVLFNYNDKPAALIKLITPFEKIPMLDKDMNWVLAEYSPYESKDCRNKYTISLMKRNLGGGLFDEEIDKIERSVDGFHHLYDDNIEQSSFNYLYYKGINKNEDYTALKSGWVYGIPETKRLLSGEPLIFVFDNNQDINPNDDLYVKINWQFSSTSDSNPYATYKTPKYETGKGRSNSIKYSELISNEDIDKNHNHYQDEFETIAEIPSVTTNPATDFTQNSVKLNGEVASDGGAPVTKRGFYWSTTNTNPGENDNILEAESGTGNFSKVLSNLQPETKIYYRAFAVNSEGPSVGDVLNCTTLSITLSAPSVTTNPASNINSNSVTLNGEVTSDGGANVTNRGFYWSTSNSTPNQNDNILESGTGTGNFSKIIENLQPETKIYYRAFAINSEGTSVGEILSFTTLKMDNNTPTVVTLSQTNVTGNSATLNGEVTSDGGADIIARGFYWSITNTNPAENDNTLNADLGVGLFSKTLENIYAETTVYFKAFAQNINGISTGNVKSFKTSNSSMIFPKVTTYPAENITYTTALLKANVDSDGGGEILSRGFKWGTDINNLDNSQGVGTGSGSFELEITGLEPGSIYYYTAWANSEGYGTEDDIMSFTTKEDDGLPSGSTSSLTDSRDSKIYKTVKIGYQWWMAENLAYLPEVSSPSDESRTEPFYYVYDYQGASVSTAKSTDNYETYGVLYNWPAALTACPTGWHLPTIDEWIVLSDYLINNGYGYGGSGDDIAKSMAAKTNWNSFSSVGTPGNNPDSNNSSGFSTLPGGYRTADGSFSRIGYAGYWWSATETSSNYARLRWLLCNSPEFYRNLRYKDLGYSVRCVRD